MLKLVAGAIAALFLVALETVTYWSVLDPALQALKRSGTQGNLTAKMALSPLFALVLGVTALILTGTGIVEIISERNKGRQATPPRAPFTSPTLYVHFIPGNQRWCIPRQGSAQGQADEMMQVMFVADLNHDSPTETLVITDAYPKGTTPQVAAFDKVKIPPHTMLKERIMMAFVTPVVGKKGKPWNGRIVFVRPIPAEA